MSYEEEKAGAKFNSTVPLHQQRMLYAMEYIAVQLDKIVTILEDQDARIKPDPDAWYNRAKAAPVDDTPTTATLQQRAEYNREHAAELFSDKLVYIYSAQRWFERISMTPVVFTPYGWVKESDLDVDNLPHNTVS